MLEIGITCGCSATRHISSCLRSPAALTPRRWQRVAPTAAARAALVVVCEDKRQPKKLPGGKPSRTFKAGSQTPAAGQQTPSPPPPPRILPAANFPLSRQIQAVQAAQAPQSLLQKRQAQAFRRPSQSEEEFRVTRASRAAETARLSRRESKNFALSSLYQTDRGMTRTPKVLLVDGYNVLFKWKAAEELRGAGDLASARELLVEALTTYSHHNRVRVVVAFDAMSGPGKATEEELRPTGLTVVYCGDQEADTFIEAQVEHFLERGYHQVVVATSDALHADNVRGKSAAAHQTCHVVPASGLINDMERTQRDSAQAVAGTRDRPVLALLGSAVKDKDAATFATLQKWRIGDGSRRRYGGGGGGGGESGGGGADSGGIRGSLT